MIRIILRPLRRVLGSLVCLVRGHRNTAAFLPEHGFGLYAFSWIGCGRCGRTEREHPVAFAPCGECPEGRCDGCEGCALQAEMLAEIADA